jgi:hypothetical protein
MNADQERYLDSLLDKSERELLFEIARASYSPIMASGGKRSQQGPVRFPVGQIPSREQLNRVPNGPVTEPQKAGLVSFLNIAQKRVDTMHARLYAALCDSANKKPTDSSIDIATGQVKDIVAAAVSILLTKYNTEVSIGIPVAVYYLKKGLFTFCQNPPTGHTRALP